MNDIAKQINEKTGAIGKELENLTYATAYFMALLAKDESAMNHFKKAYERTE